MPSVSRAWGFAMHEAINTMAIALADPDLQPFVRKHADYLIQHSTRPDKRRHSDPHEAPRHYIDLELYPCALHHIPHAWDSAVARFGPDSLHTWGIVPWHIHRMRAQLVAAFQAKNTEQIRFLMADIGHYAADAMVPLHTTVNYDGQLTEQHGIHALWESQLPETYFDTWFLPLQPVRSGRHNIDSMLWRGIQEAHAVLPDILAGEAAVAKQYGQREFQLESHHGHQERVFSPRYAEAYEQTQGPIIAKHLAASVHMVVAVWNDAYERAGRPQLPLD